MGIGARTIKTGIAVALSVYVCVLFDISPALFAATSAVVCMQQSIGKSLRNAFQQVIVNLTAIAIGVVLGLTIPILYVSMAIATILVILFCTKVYKTPNLIVMAIITAIFIISSPQDEFTEHAVMRALAIFIGIGIGNIVNFTLAQPHYQKPLVSKLIQLNEWVIPSFSNSVNAYLTLDIPPEEELKNQQDNFSTLYQDAENLLDLFNDEFKLTLGAEKVRKKTKQEQLYRDYLNYNRGIWQRSLDIIFLTQERKARREEFHEPSVSAEFHQVFDMLTQVIAEAEHYNSELLKKLRGEISKPYPELRVWTRFNQQFTKWQERNPNTTYYLSAIFEVSVIVFNIRWFAKESSRLLNS